MKKRLLFISIFIISIKGFSQEQLKRNNYKDVFNEATLSIEKNDYQKTVEILDRIHPNDSTYTSATITKTYYLLQNEKYEEVIKICDTYLNEFESDSKLSLFINKGVALEGLKMYQEAIAVYDKAIKNFPKYYLLWYNKGTSLSLSKKYKEAYTAFKKAMIYNPLYKDIHLQLGDLYYKHGKTTQALMCYNIYTILNLESENASEMLMALNVIAAKENPNKPKDFQENDDLYEELDLIVKSNMALSKDYEIGNEYTFPLIKQNHAILEKIIEIEEDNSFFGQRYLELHKWLKLNNYFNDYTYTALYGIENKKYQKKIKKHEKDIISFYKVFISKWLALNSTNIDIVNGSKSEYNFLYSEDNTVEAIGKLKDGKKLGSWNVYNDSGQKSLTAFFNESEEKTNTWKWFYPNGNTKEINNYVANVMEGESAMFHENGKKYIETSYKSGELNGNYKYFNPKGALIQNKNFSNGLLEGLYRAYFPVGEKIVEYNIPYKEDKIEGVFTEYYANGDVYYQVNYKDDQKQGIEKTYYYDNVLMKEVAYKDGKMNGDFKFYAPNGTLIETGKTVDDVYVGEWKLYYDDGTFQKSYTYEKGFIEGISKFYDTGGKLHYEFEYKKGDVIAYKYYNKDGVILKEENKKRGALFFESYSPEGIVSIKGNYDIKGGREGVWEFYTSNGTLETKSNYVDNNIEGESTGYYKDGAIKFTSNYTNDNLEGYYVGYYNNGQMEHQGYYEEGLATGEWRYYYQDGAIESINYFHKGNLHGKQQYFTPNGKLYNTAEYNFGAFLKEAIYDVKGAVFEEVNLELKAGNTKVVYKHYNNKDKYIINYENGVKHGLYTSYDFYGNKRIEGNYVNNTMHGEWKWYYKNGTVESVRNYKLGELYGKSVDYFESGATQEVQTYYNDENEGESITYFEDGTIDRKSVYKTGKFNGRREFYDVSGELQLIRFYNHGRLIGYSYLDTSGKEIAMIPIKNETVKIKSFYKSGNVSREIEFENGNFINEYKTYFSNGKLANELYYNKSGQLNGVEKEYYTNGNVKIERPYVLGKQKGIYKEFYANGAIKKEQTYSNGQLNGVTKNYDEAGKLLQEEQYFNGDIYEVTKR